MFLDFNIWMYINCFTAELNHIANSNDPWGRNAGFTGTNELFLKNRGWVNRMDADVLEDNVWEKTKYIYEYDNCLKS